MSEKRTLMVTEKKLINQAFLNSINEKLSTFGFSSEDFTITQQRPEDEINRNVFINIKYHYNDAYSFLTVISDKLDVFAMSYSPGRFLATENKSVKNVSEYLVSIEEWVETLRIELKASPLGRQMAESEEQIKEHLNRMEEKFTEADNSYYSIEEGNELKNKLDKFEKDFKEKEEKDEKLHLEIEMLKEQVAYLSKKKWKTAFAVKLFNWISRNPDAAKLIVQVGRNMIPEELEGPLSDLLPEPQNKK